MTLFLNLIVSESVLFGLVFSMCSILLIMYFFRTTFFRWIYTKLSSKAKREGWNDKTEQIVSNPDSDLYKEDTLRAQREYKLAKKSYTIEQQKHRRIVLIEDNSELANFILEILSNEGFEVLNARNGKEGLDILREWKSDLIISDMMIPEKDDFNFLEELRKDEVFETIPVVFLTGLSDSKDRSNRFKIGVNDYILKPFNTGQLLVRVIKLLELSDLRVAQSKNVIPQKNYIMLRNSDDEFVRKMLNWIEIRMDIEKLTPDNLAREMSVSRRTLYREIKRITGLTVAGFLKEVQLQYALIFAETSSVKSIGALSRKVGFSNSSYFREQFIQRFGKDPFG